MSADQQADLFRELPPDDRERLLPLLNPHTRRGLTLLLQYEPDTAGGMMTTEFLTVAADTTAAGTMELIRRVSGNKETVYAIYVTDPATQALMHVVSLRELVMADPATLMGKVGTARTVLSVRPHTDREDVARLISKYNLLAAPVVDRDRKILGIVTVDDVIDALVREGTEDVQKFGGVAAFDEPYTEMSFGGMIRKRAGWLCVLFLSEMLTATAMQHFEGELARAVVLTLFIPLIMSSGGNSGSQATSLIIRALAIREIAVKDWWRVAVRELPSGLVLGAILGVIGIVRISLWQYLAPVRLRSALAPGGADGGVRAGGGGDLRLAGRIDAAVRAQAARLRPGERIGAVRGHAGGRDRPGDLLQRGGGGAARHAALSAPQWRLVSARPGRG